MHLLRMDSCLKAHQRQRLPVDNLLEGGNVLTHRLYSCTTAALCTARVAPVDQVNQGDSADSRAIRGAPAQAKHMRGVTGRVVDCFGRKLAAMLTELVSWRGLCFAHEDEVDGDCSCGKTPLAARAPAGLS